MYIILYFFKSFIDNELLTQLIADRNLITYYQTKKQHFIKLKHSKILPVDIIIY